MPIYVHECPACGERSEHLRPIRLMKAKVDCDSCGARTRRLISPPSRFGVDYLHEALDDSAGVAPSQVAEHRRRFPDIPMTNDGRVVVKNATERNRIVRRLNTILSDG